MIGLTKVKETIGYQGAVASPWGFSAVDIINITPVCHRYPSLYICTNVLTESSNVSSPSDPSFLSSIPAFPALLSLFPPESLLALKRAVLMSPAHQVADLE